MLHQYMRSIINIDDSFNKSLWWKCCEERDNNKQQHVGPVTCFDCLHEDVKNVACIGDISHHMRNVGSI